MISLAFPPKIAPFIPAYKRLVQVGADIFTMSKEKMKPGAEITLLKTWSKDETAKVKRSIQLSVGHSDGKKHKTSSV